MLSNKASYLDQWVVVHKNMFGTNHSIPPGSEIHLSKLKGGLITIDTCKSAHHLGKMLVVAVDNAVAEKQQLVGPNNNNPNRTKTVPIIIQHCHNHMQNVSIKAVVS